MSIQIRPGRYLEPIKSDGTPAALSGQGFYTLVAGTYYVELGGGTSPLLSAHLQWSAALAGTITVEDSNADPHQVALTSSTAGDWIQENPSTAYVGTAGTGNTASNLTITAGGSNAGGAMIHLGNTGAARTRLSMVISVGGTFRCGQFGKS